MRGAEILVYVILGAAEFHSMIILRFYPRNRTSQASAVSFAYACGVFIIQDLSPRLGPAIFQWLKNHP